ncbi:probable 4-coumarate--CoA ligase 1 isoform X2 [Gordionus sp. m RMFG-2023]
MNHLEESELILESKYSDLVIPSNTTLSNFLINEFKKIGDKEAVIDIAQSKTFTYPNLLTLSRNVCSSILTYEIKQGDGVALLLPNCCESVCIFIGVIGGGGTVIFINLESNDEEIEFQLLKSAPRFVFTTMKQEERIKAISESVKSIEQIFVLFGESKYCITYAQFLSEADPTVIARTKLSVEPKTDIAAIFFTRGRTSGTARGVMLSHYNIIANLYQIRVMYDIHSNDQIFSTIPMHTTYGFVISTLYSLIQGSALYLLPDFQPALFLETIQKGKISHIYMTPDTANLINEDSSMANCDFSHVKEIIFGTDLPTSHLVEEIRAKYKTLKDIRFSFSMTELSPISHVTPPKSSRVGSFGVVLPNTLCKLLAVESKELLGPNRKGQMCLKGPQVFIGYLNDEAATAKVLGADGWFYTDDVVYYDKEQHFYYVSPISDYIKMKEQGKPSITPQEIQETREEYGVHTKF